MQNAALWFSDDKKAGYAESSLEWNVLERTLRNRLAGDLPIREAKAASQKLSVV